MTWVMGATTWFGYGILVGDTRITARFSDGRVREFEAAQKIYDVGNYVAMGFAGSVPIGFRSRDILRHTAAESERYGAQAYWDLRTLINRCVPLLQTNFQNAEHADQQQGCELLVLAAEHSPKAFRQTNPVGARLIAPDFEPEFFGPAMTIRHIGSGAADKDYCHSVESLMQPDSINLMTAEVGPPGGWSSMFLDRMTHILRERPRPGIGSHLHMINVHLGRLSGVINDMDFWLSDGRTEQFRMPRVGTSLEAVLDLLNSATEARGACELCC